MSRLTIAMAQINPLVGDIEGNAERILASCRQARETVGADLVVFPELSLTGYPPEDLLLRPSLALRVERALAHLCRELPASVTAVIGVPTSASGGLHNSALVLQDGAIIARYAKQLLPNYRVFDEKRYFTPGDAPCVFDVRGVRCGLTICEDIWFPGPATQARDQGAELLLNLSASPYNRRQHQQRLDALQQRVAETGLPIVYVNQIGGQDELVFDGCSMALGRDGGLRALAPAFAEGIYHLHYQPEQRDLLPAEIVAPLPSLPSVYRALVTGVRDYINKNGFPGVVLGLSGGIDSALTLAIAVDALGADRVEAVMMPYHYTSDISLADAADQARRLGVRYRVISIAPMVESFQQALASEFAGLPVDNTEQNLQARCRGVLLMAISNKKGSLVLTTGNKSEMAVGYATLYGDMAGGFDVLKDVPKTLVFQLARYRNALGEIIPDRVITRPPSAELAPDQKDEDNLPPYEVLDQILELYIEQDMSATAIVQRGFEEATVRRVLRLVDVNEYKRRQAAIGPRITERGFGRDRRYPITSGWRIGD